MAKKKCTLSTVKLPLGGLSRNSVVWITDRPDMTLAVYRGRKASTQTNKTIVSSLFNKDYNIEQTITAPIGVLFTAINA